VYDFEGEGSVVVSDDTSTGQDAVADAVRLVYVGSLPTATPTPSVNLPPQLGTVTPSSGSGQPGQFQTFTTTWSDPDGWQDLKLCYFHVGATADLQHNVTLLYNAQNDRLWLLDDDGAAWVGGYAPGSADVLENSQAQVDCAATTVQASNDTLSVQWAISFTESFAGAKKTGLKCKDHNGAHAKGAWKGTWTVVP
jgi:hypothetical protein